MKEYEKRAIEKAIELAEKQVNENRYNDYIPEGKLNSKIAYRAVRIAELRAKRCYDFKTRQEAFEYALNLLNQN